MQQVPGTYSMTWTEIQRLDLATFDKLLNDKASMIKDATKARR